MEQDCFFEIINDNGKMRMSAKCVDCCKENTNDKFFWQGSKRGYGKYKVVCEKCNKLIYDPTSR